MVAPKPSGNRRFRPHEYPSAAPPIKAEEAAFPRLGLSRALTT
jgi:hypothetical protein